MRRPHEPRRSLAQRRVVAVALLAIFATAWLAPTAAAGITAEQAIAEFNQWRTGHGLHPVALDPGGSEGCRLHNAYLQLNGYSHLNGAAHYEDPGLPGYTPHGATAGAGSNLTNGERGPLSWLPFIYHRRALMNPRARVAWFDASSGFSCMGTADDGTAVGPATPTFYTWPADGERDVAAFGPGPRQEWPDPYDHLPQGTTRIGSVLSAVMDAPGPAPGATVQVTSASLVPDGGGAALPLDIWDRDPARFGNGFAIFPLEWLAIRTWYTASVQGVYGDSDIPFDLTWRFRTMRPPPALSHSYDESNETVWVKSDNTAVPAHVRITRADGRVMFDQVMAANSTAHLALAPGQYFSCAEQIATDDFLESTPCSGSSPDITVLLKAHARVAKRKLKRARASFTITVPSVSVGMQLQTTLEGWVRRCSRSGRCKSSWRTLKRVAPKLRTARQRVTIPFHTAHPLRKARVKLYVPGDESATVPYAGESRTFIIRR